MKKFTALIIIATLLFSLVSCGNEEYPPVASSELESNVVMTVEFEGDKYEVKYELYRALFLNIRGTVDGGDLSVWSGDNKDAYIAQIDEIIREHISDIYAIFHIAKKIGIDPYSKDFDKTVNELISLSVNGSGEDLIGFGGDYDKYLAHLKKMNMNYSVQDLLFRYELASTKIFEYYAGYSGEFVEESVHGHLEYTHDTVEEFYFSNDCVRVLKAYLSKDWFSYEDAVLAREKIIEQASYGEIKVAEKIIGLVGTFAPSAVFCGDIIGHHNLDDAYYKELERIAFELPYSAVSEVIEITSDESAYVILYKTTKSKEHFDTYYDSISAAYVENEIGKIIDTVKDGIKSNIKNTSFLDSLERSGISMQ